MELPERWVSNVATSRVFELETQRKGRDAEIAEETQYFTDSNPFQKQGVLIWLTLKFIPLLLKGVALCNVHSLSSAQRRGFWGIESSLILPPKAILPILLILWSQVRGCGEI